MSLIVAQATESGPRIVSDVRLTFPDGRVSNYKTGTLKAVIVSPDLTICFAGNATSGLRGVREFASSASNGRALGDLLPRLQEFASAESVDFIVASTRGGPQLTRIRSDGVENDLHAAWIGDADAFDRFQRQRNIPPDSFDLFSAPNRSPGSKVMETLQRAMQAVIDDPAIPSVGGFCVSVAATPRGFEYLASIFIYLERDITVQAGDDLISKMAQPVEEGGFAVSVVEPREPGTPALGLNFPRARLGMIFLPLQFDDAQVISDVSPRDFARAVLEHFGVAMKEPNLR